jgi:hypothetical protein
MLTSSTNVRVEEKTHMQFETVVNYTLKSVDVP